MAFDTLTFAKKLQEAGVPSQQAEAHAEALRGLVEGNLATKRDIEELRSPTQRDLKEVESRLLHEIELVRRDVKEMETGLRRDMKEMEARITFRLGGIVVAGFTWMTALIGVVIALVTS